MALSQTNINLITLKKALGLTHTSTAKTLLANEDTGSAAQLSVNTIFGNPIPSTPLSTGLGWVTDGVVQYVRFQLSEIAGTNTQGFQITLPSDYETNDHYDSSSKTGTGRFVASEGLPGSKGALQIIPPGLFGSAYLPKLYTGGTVATKGSGTQIYPLDSRDWLIDYYAGIYFQEDTGGSTPEYMEAWLYVGDMVSDRLEVSGIFKPTGSYQSTINNLRITGSVQISGSYLKVVDGFISGSFQGDGSGLTNISAAALPGGLSPWTSSVGEISRLGNVRVIGTLTATTFVVSSSVSYFTQSFSSGSTQFGDSVDDIHAFSGSLYLVASSSFYNSTSVEGDGMFLYIRSGSGQIKATNTIDAGGF